ncbi:T-cell surface glycoprotein CD8 alpha chain [Eucyclogobius newberryi]|uniref:T-cell surface glycoprotein CD8 alpha chain n=1 Tax=Eucyclogobius newberryi TaxID=166745 RepID=UPI003B5B6B4C
MEREIVFVLGFFLIHQGASAAPPEVRQVREGQRVEISCRVTDSGPSVVWFRVLDASGMHHIASITSMNPAVKKEGDGFKSLFDTSKISSHVLVLKAFSSSDAGTYSCLSMNKEMKFGPVTRLHTEPPAGGTTSTKKTTPTTRPLTPEPCSCPTPAAVAPTHCSVLILAPLAGGCGLLLLILLCTVLYCNSVRTRRCPHHYRRKPRAAAPDKHFKTNTHF